MCDIIESYNLKQNFEIFMLYFFLSVITSLETEINEPLVLYCKPIRKKYQCNWNWFPSSKSNNSLT